MQQFFNPYHFVPVRGGPRAGDIKRELLEKPLPRDECQHLTHDRFVAQTRVSGVDQPVYSGRILCRLTTESPLVIGANQDDKKSPKTVEPFTLPDGTPAVPASSLRGLISSIAEAASNSALRVLSNPLYSVRFGPRDAPPASSASSRWRRPAGHCHDYFRSVWPELLPFNPKRQQVSIAEQMFGFVEESASKPTESEAGLALASRVRFSHAIVAPGTGGLFISENVAGPGAKPELFILRELSAPKPPSPSMYFTWRLGERKHIAKKMLSPELHVPQGRKFYLHDHHPDDDQFWRSNDTDADALKRKNSVQLLRSGLNFYFHLDVFNLSRNELSVLCYALRPTEAFRHQLGMGKPLGLGRVRIEAVGLFFVDRLARYRQTDLFDTIRYSCVAVEPHPEKKDWRAELPRERYSSEIAGIQGQGSARTPSFQELRDEFAKEFGGTSELRALELIGDPASTASRPDIPVHYPQVASGDPALSDETKRLGLELERELFCWFVANDTQHRSWLDPLPTQSGELPALRRHPSRDRNAPPRGGQR